MSAAPAPQTVSIRTATIELAQFLKFAGVADSGGEAKQAIVNGLVKLNGAVETQRGKKVKSGDTITFEGKSFVVKSEA